MFNELVDKVIIESSSSTFVTASVHLKDYIFNLPDIKPLVMNIGIIPERISRDSTEEKVFAKASDIVFARALYDMGLTSNVLEARGNAADVSAQSTITGSTMVGDAKAFRMSRTAKNQKDFKVEALDQWRNNSDYAVLAAPYFQYPTHQSQIYSQALSRNVLLFSWEHILLLLNKGFRESSKTVLDPIWNWSNEYANKVLLPDRNRNFLKDFNKCFLTFFGYSANDLKSTLKEEIDVTQERANLEKKFWIDQAKRIQSLSREDAIASLLEQTGIDGRLGTIDRFIGGLNEDRYID